VVVVAESRSGERSVALDGGQHRIGHSGLLAKESFSVLKAGALPADGIVRQLLDRQDVQTLVVDLNEPPILAVEPLLAPPALIAPDPRVEDQVVVAGARDLQRVELEEPQSVDHAEHRLGLRRKRPRRSQ
jgi:hypothetical protein